VVAQQQDLETARASLSAWLAGKLRGADEVALSSLTKPGVGFSNETLLAGASWREGGEQRSERLVFRLEPRDMRVFPDYDLAKQVGVMRCLAGTSVPVPEVLWLEEDERFAGSPFYVMRHIDGAVPPDVPFYHTTGVLAEAAPAKREAMWWRGIDTLARVHTLDWQSLGLSFLGAPGGGTAPLDAQLDYYERFLRWAQHDEPQPVLDAALEWLRAHRFAPACVALCWGDSRLPNIIFHDAEVAAVLDWEMAFLGDPEADLAWWLFLDWHHSEGHGVARLPGLPGRDETVRRYEQLTGRKVEQLFYHEVMAGLRFGVIMVSLYRQLRQLGAPAQTPGRGLDSPITRRLAALLDIPFDGP
jgi:aminoglycoside phosphotransferase (APT) family kinase protein